MAAPCTNWYEKLKVHPLCKQLEEKNVQRTESDILNDAKSLIAVKNGDLFIWNSSSLNVIHCNLNSLLSEHEDAYTRFQVLHCTDTPRFEVDGLLLNSSGNQLAIWGPRGIRVMELPQRRGKFSEFEGGKDVITCKTISICSRQLVGSQWLQIHKISWHPGSSSGIHLAVLTSDNVFSIYSLLEPDRPTKVTYIQPQNEASISFTSPNKLNIMTALGETTVGFDFGPPQEMQRLPQPFQIPKQEDVLTVWPVFFVKGNGDIIVSYSEVTSNRPLQLPLQGPLVMCPPAEDNYGVDACSVLCLDTLPPVIVMATCDGHLHHCVVLPNSEGNSAKKEMQLPPGMPQYRHPGELLLYVMETVELELSLANVSSDLGNSDLRSNSFTCPIKLMKDPCCPERYHCLHSAGIHSIALPWIASLHMFLSDASSHLTLPDDQESVVEHLICTKPLHSSPVAPVLGMDVISDPTLSPTMLVLSMEKEFHTLPMSNKYKVPWRYTRDAISIESPTRQREIEPFNQQISRILHRSVSNPLLMTSAKTEMSSEACYQLLVRVTQVLREEYIQKQEHARHEIETRVEFLRHQKEQQLRELQELEMSKENVTEKAGHIAESLELCHDNNANLLRRLESIMRKIQSRVPVLSLAEKEMKAELNQLEEKVKDYSINLKQLHKKLEYQQRYLGQPKISSQESSVMQPQQLNNIKNILHEEGDEIGHLMKQISQLKMEINL